MDLRDDGHIEAPRTNGTGLRGHGRPHAGQACPNNQNVMDFLQATHNARVINTLPRTPLANHRDHANLPK